MTPERWHKIDEIFHTALARPKADRTVWLRRACGVDLALYAEVESLLARDAAPAALLDVPIAECVAKLWLGAPEIDFAGRRLGPYKLLRELGRGGAGTVYLAVRADGRYEQDVAVKIIHAAKATPEVRRRFEREQQILARLDHPNIARLLDAGTTDEGLPFVVMDCVEGEPIDRWCATRNLGLGARLKIFRQVCSAVHYAHQNLVIHRDLKPGNILVTHDGVPKLLDFGIAKLLDTELDAASLHRTAPSLTPMTPAYASPEQVRAEPISTASDVYSLGVLLYLLLTGSLPYCLDRKTPREVERAICELEPPSPSATVSGSLRIFRPQLEGDLDHIVRKALDKEPRERYTSAEQFSDDLGRHLLHLPVLARRSTWLYRTRKLLRRHRLASALSVLLLVAGIAVTVQSVRATRGWEAAALQSARAEQVAAVLVQLFEIADPDRSRGDTLTAREALDLGAGTVLGQLEDQPLTQAALMETIGLVYQKLGLFENAAPLLEEALGTRRRELGDHHADVARSLSHVAYQRLVQGEHAAAEALYRQALAVRQQLYGRRHLEVAASFHDIGEVHHERGEFGDAEAFYLQALELRRHLGGEDHPAIAESLIELGRLHLDRGESPAAVTHLRRALEIEIQTRGERHTRVALIESDLARILQSSAPEEAENLFRRALATYRDLVGPEHTWTTIVMRNLARLLRDRGDFDEAETLIREALETRRRHWPADDPRVAYAAQDLGLLALARNDPQAAEAPLFESWTILRQALTADDWRAASARSVYGECLSRLGRSVEAEVELLASFETLAHALGEDHRRTRRAAQRLAAHYALVEEAAVEEAVVEAAVVEEAVEDRRQSAVHRVPPAPSSTR